MSTMVVGVGNAFRGDDGVGLEVIRLLRAAAPAGVSLLACEGEPISLLDTWDGAGRVVLVDAMRSGAPAGTVRRIAVDEEPLPPELTRPSTHLLGVAEAVELGRVLGRLPEEVVVYAIEGKSWDTGAGLSPAAAEAARRVAAAVEEEVS